MVDKSTELTFDDVDLEKLTFIYKYNFLQHVNSTEQTPFIKGFPFDTHWSAELTEAMRIKCLTRGQETL